jgi:predicted Zn-dependent protease
MSAAVLIVDGESHDHRWEGVLVDVRVDHDDQPLDQIERLLGAADAFDHCDRAEVALFGGDPAAALREVDLALDRLPGDENARFMRAGALLVSGQPQAGLDELRALIAARPSWAVVVRSFAASDQLHLPEGFELDDIIG